MPNISTPDLLYRAFWVTWTIYVGAALVVLGVLGFVAARLWLVNPIVHAIERHYP